MHNKDILNLLGSEEFQETQSVSLRKYIASDLEVKMLSMNQRTHLLNLVDGVH